MVLAWWVIAGVGVIGYGHAWLMNLRLSNDLRIDKASGCLTVARSYGHSEPVEIPLSSVRQIEIEKIKDLMWTKQTVVRYAVYVEYCDRQGGETRRNLAEWFGRVDATLLAKSLRTRLGLSPSGDSAAAAQT